MTEQTHGRRTENLRLLLTESAAQAMRAHAEETYPYECCGLLVGELDADGTRRIRTAYRARNLNTERARDRFQLDPQDWLRIDQEAAAAGLAILGCYHSHPDHPPRPSRTDAEHAFPEFSYVILSVRQGRLAGFRSWRFFESPDPAAQAIGLDGCFQEEEVGCF